VLGIADADSEEHGSGSRSLVVAQVSCPVPGRQPGAPRLSGRLRLTIVPGTRLASLMGAATAEEVFTCNFEASPLHVPALLASGLVACARGDGGELRAVELPEHPFFIATLYQPQLSSSAAWPHPLLTGFVKAAAAQFAARRASPPR
jgi:CTP synthase (UTP-ammonia lyase)